MPIYEFECRACGCGFEELFRSADEKRTVRCPDCRSRKVEKQWSAFGVSVKGARAATSSCSGNGCSHCSGGWCKNCGH